MDDGYLTVENCPLLHPESATRLAIMPQSSFLLRSGYFYQISSWARKERQILSITLSNWSFPMPEEPIRWLIWP